MVQTEQLKDFFGIIRAFEDNGVIVRFPVDFSAIYVDCGTFKFNLDFNLDSFDYNSLVELIKNYIDDLHKARCLDLMFERLNSKKNGTQVNDK